MLVVLLKSIIQISKKKMNRSALNLFFILLIGSVSAFIEFENNVEYEFRFKSKLNLSPSFLEGQSANATLLVRKFGTDGSSLVVRIKDSQAVGKGITSESQSNIEGVFGIKRNANGAITHIISKSRKAKEILTKKNIAGMLTNDFSFFNNYMRNHKSRSNRHHVELSIGWCDANITARTDPASGLSSILAQSEKRECDVNPLVLKGGQYLLQGTTKQIGEIKEDSSIGMIVLFDTKTKKMLEVSKFTFLNLVVFGLDVQARHNMILEYVGEHPLSSETYFQEPYVSLKFCFRSMTFVNFIFIFSVPVLNNRTG